MEIHKFDIDSGQKNWICIRFNLIILVYLSDTICIILGMDLYNVYWG